MKTYQEIKEIMENIKVDELDILESSAYGLTAEETELYAYVSQKEAAYNEAKFQFEKSQEVKGFDLDGAPLY